MWTIHQLHWEIASLFDTMKVHYHSAHAYETKVFLEGRSHGDGNAFDANVTIHAMMAMYVKSVDEDLGDLVVVDQGDALVHHTNSQTWLRSSVDL